MAKRRRRTVFRVPEQLLLPLTWRPPPVHEVERVQVGHFLGVKFSDGCWQLTVAEAVHSYVVEHRTPQRWWANLARQEFTLHKWSECGQLVVGERDEPDMDPRRIELRVVAVRWLRTFNEAFQTWRMSPTC